MNKCAVLHTPLSQFAYAEDEHTIRLRLRAEKNDIQSCFVFYGDRVSPVDPVPVRKQKMELFAKDDLYDYFEALIKDRYTRVCYYFTLDDGREKLFYSERGLEEKITGNRTEYFQFPYIRREDIPDIPAWAEDAVMYQIFPDSFADKKRGISGKKRQVRLADGQLSGSRLGGTLGGITQNLDYLEEMGINCLYLNPIFTAASYHKYDTIDYYSVDPCLGTARELKELVKVCHEKGMRVILDGVFNHCGAGFFAFQDVLQRGKESAYYDWFYQMPSKVEFKDPPEYEAFAYVKEMPKLNTGNPVVAEYFAQVGKYWIQEADIDGWRLDVANEINHEFWRNFRRQVRSVKADALLIGEIWEDAQPWLMGDQFDSTMNYPFSYLCREFFACRRIAPSEFDQQINRMLLRYSEPVNRVQMNLLDSHDVPRFLSICGEDKKRLELAMFFMLMMEGFPSVFYGDETYIMGETEEKYREAMPWTKIGEGFAGRLRQWIDIRKGSEAIKKGSFRTCFCEDTCGIYFFEREYKDKRVLVGLNNSDTEAFVNSSGLSIGEKDSLRDLLTGERADNSVRLAPMEGRVFEIIRSDLLENNGIF